MPGGVNITHWRRTRYLLGGAGQRRLSGLFPFQYAYLAKSPGNLIRLGNLKTRVAAGMTAGQGDDFFFFFFHFLLCYGELKQVSVRSLESVGG